MMINRGDSSFRAPITTESDASIVIFDPSLQTLPKIPLPAKYKPQAEFIKLDKSNVEQLHQSPPSLANNTGDIDHGTQKPLKKYFFPPKTNIHPLENSRL
jgi:hypothetical protein